MAGFATLFKGLNPELAVCHSKLEPVGQVLVTKPFNVAVVAGHTFDFVVALNVGAVVPALPCAARLLQGAGVDLVRAGAADDRHAKNPEARHFSVGRRSAYRRRHDRPARPEAARPLVGRFGSPHPSRGWP